VKYLVAALRLAVALLGLVAIVSTFFDTATRATINPFNFFGYFTMQSNIILVVVLLLAALVSFSGPRQSRSLVLALGCATTYIVTTGVVYNVLLAGLEGGRFPRLGEHRAARRAARLCRPRLGDRQRPRFPPPQ